MLLILRKEFETIFTSSPNFCVDYEFNNVYNCRKGAAVIYLLDAPAKAKLPSKEFDSRSNRLLYGIWYMVYGIWYFGYFG